MDKANPGDVIVFTKKSLLNEHGDEDRTVIERPSNMGTKYSGDCPWIELRGVVYYVQHDHYKIVRRGGARTTIVVDDVDAFLEKQRNEQLSDLFGCN